METEMVLLVDSWIPRRLLERLNACRHLPCLSTLSTRRYELLSGSNICSNLALEISWTEVRNYSSTNHSSWPYASFRPLFCPVAVATQSYSRLEEKFFQIRTRLSLASRPTSPLDLPVVSMRVGIKALAENVVPLHMTGTLLQIFLAGP